MAQRYYSATIAPAALDRDGFAAAQQLAGAGALILNGVLSTQLVRPRRPDIPRHVGIYSAGNLSAVTFTVVYLARNGATVTEALTGPNNSTVETVGNCAELVSVTASAAVGSDVEVGTTGAFETEWVPIDVSSPENFSVTSSYYLSGTANLTYTQQWTPENIHAIGEQDIVDARNEANLTAKTATDTLSWDGRAKAVRTKVTLFVAGSFVVTHQY